jgi:hypothetical protein
MNIIKQFFTVRTIDKILRLPLLGQLAAVLILSLAVFLILWAAFQLCCNYTVADYILAFINPGSVYEYSGENGGVAKLLYFGEALFDQLLVTTVLL